MLDGQQSSRNDERGFRTPCFGSDVVFITLRLRMVPNPALMMIADTAVNLDEIS